MKLASPLPKLLKRAAAACFIWLAIFFPGPLWAAQNEPADGPLRAGIVKGLNFLTAGGKEWMDGHNCASCHHAPLTIWTLQHAKQRGFAIDREALDEISSWSLDPKTKMRPEPVTKPEPWTNKPLPVVAYFTLASDRAEPPLLPAELRATFVRHFLETQEADGSWLSYVAHPPLIDRGETSTAYVLVALLGKDSAAESNAPDWPDRKRRALEYLATVKPGDELQPKLWRLLLRTRLGEAGPGVGIGLAGKNAGDEQAVLDQQHEDGGWGQTPSLPSDAYATGQVLYFLEAARGEIPPETRRKAVAFLLKTQKENGSWAMTSRPRTLPEPNKGANNLDIIGYAGSAWATMGLISASGGR